MDLDSRGPGELGWMLEDEVESLLSKLCPYGLLSSSFHMMRESLPLLQLNKPDKGVVNGCCKFVRWWLVKFNVRISGIKLKLVVMALAQGTNQARGAMWSDILRRQRPLLLSSLRNNLNLSRILNL